MSGWFFRKSEPARTPAAAAPAPTPPPPPPPAASSAPVPPAPPPPPPPTAPQTAPPAPIPASQSGTNNVTGGNGANGTDSGQGGQPKNIVQMLSSIGKLQPLRSGASSGGGGVQRISSPTGDGTFAGGQHQHQWSQQKSPTSPTYPYSAAPAAAPQADTGPPPIRYEPPGMPPSATMRTGRYSHVHTKSNPYPGQQALPGPPAPMSQSGKSHTSKHSEHLEQALTPYNPNGPPVSDSEGYGYDTSLAPYNGGQPPPPIPSNELQPYVHPPDPEQQQQQQQHQQQQQQRPGHRYSQHGQRPPPHQYHQQHPQHPQQYGYPPGPHGYGPPQGYMQQPHYGSPHNQHPGYGPQPGMYGAPPYDDYYASEVSYSTAPSQSPPPPGNSRPHSTVSGRQKRDSKPVDNSLQVIPVEDAPTWPPPGRTHGLLTAHEAEQWIVAGTPQFSGKVKNLPCAPKGHYRFFGLTYVGNSKEPGLDDAMPPQESLDMDSFEDMTSALSCLDAWERPAMSGSHGIYPGTVTLSYYVATYGTSVHLLLKPSEKVKPRKIGMLYVLDQLRYLQHNDLDDTADPAALYRTLYEYLLIPSPQPRYDPYTIEGQVHDLTSALMRHQWTDFSRLENQTVSNFFFSQEPGVTNNFFHQLLLATELMQRVEVLASTKAYRPQDRLPEKVLWDYILAKRWKERVQIETPKASSEGSSNVSFKFKYKPYQVETIKNFAFTIKWPNMPYVSDTLDEPDAPNEILEDQSVNCMAWFTGLLLPGKSMPWIAMNALIDCDPEIPEEFHNLKPDPTIGFQYRSVSYWHYENIVGRVLGASVGVKQIGGWIGPCLPSNDLERTQLVRVNQLEPKYTIPLTREDVENMHINSDPIGAEQTTIPVADYEQIILDSSPPVDTIRIEKLSFIQSDPEFQSASALTYNGKQIITQDASLTFAIDARSWRVALKFNTPFIAAYPCTKGPHVLFCEYKIRVVEVDKLVDIYEWGRPSGFRMRTANSTPAGSGLGTRNAGYGSDEEDDRDEEEDDQQDGIEEVLVVKAFGVLDNAVFARAWCSYWGVSAVVADQKQTCLACAVREAYALQICVVILTDCDSVEYEIEEVDRLMENL